MRVAILASPRSGNSWLRVLLAETLELPEFTTHNWHEVIGQVPDSCVMQVHWYREPGIQMFLRDNGFRIVTVARHPLDILLSALRFCKHDPNNARWLEGNCEIECLFDKNVTPENTVFLDWCAGFGCENLLSVTYQWFHEREAVKVHYEDLVANPRGTVDAIAYDLAGKKLSVSNATLKKFDLPYWKSLPNQHGWQGKAGLWKEFYTTESCAAIRERHRRVFDTLGYDVEGVCASNTAATISEKWKALNPEKAAAEASPNGPVPAAATSHNRFRFFSGILANR